MGQILPVARLPREVDLRFERGPDMKDVASDDVVGRMLAIEQRCRDEALYEEKIKLVREAASVCYRQYHVNQAFKCRPIYVEYLRMIQHKSHILHDIPDFYEPKTEQLAKA